MPTVPSFTLETEVFLMFLLVFAFTLFIIAYSKKVPIFAIFSAMIFIYLGIWELNDIPIIMIVCLGMGIFILITSYRLYKGDN